MKRFFVLLIINIVLVMLQNSFFAELFGANSNPNLVLAFAFGLFFLDREDFYLMSGFLGGVLLDLFGFSIVGLSALVITGTLILFSYIRRYLFKGWLSNIVLVFVAQITYIALLSGSMSVTKPTFFSGISTMLISVVFYIITQNFGGYLGRPSSEYSS